MRWLGVLAAGIVACGTFIDTTTSDEPPPVMANQGDGGVLADGAIGRPLDSGKPPGSGTVDPCAASASGPNDIHVMTSGSSDADCGSTAKPCSLKQALAKQALAKNPAQINIADGSYVVDAPLAQLNTSIFGGWTPEGGSWKRTCQSGAVKLTTPSHAGLEITTSSITLAYVDIESKATPLAGESLYGLLVTTSNVTLDHVNIVAGPGGKGQDELTPPPDSVGQGFCTGLGTGAAGTAGGPGSEGATAFTPAGVVATPGGQGSRGGNGDMGTAGEQPADTPGNFCQPVMATECTTAACMHIANPGVAGCGGNGGVGGRGGGAGGSSVGLYAASSSLITFTSGQIRSGDGGNGGLGGPGAKGAPGGAGQQGEAKVDVACPDWDCGVLSPSDNCRSIVIPPTSVPGGAAGGTGGVGGRGGVGGTGAGGHSYAVVHDGSSNVTLTGVALAHGVPGAGGGAPSAKPLLTF